MTDTEILNWLQEHARMGKGHTPQTGVDDSFVLTAVFDGYPTSAATPSLRDAVMFEVRRPKP